MDAAALSLNIDSSKVVQAANDLDRFATASDRAAASAGKVNFGNQAGSIAKLVASVQSIDGKMSALINTLSKVQQAEKALAAANDNSAASMAKVGVAVAAADSHIIAYTQHLAGLAAAQRNANAHVMAFQNHAAAGGAALSQADAHVLAYRNHLASIPAAAGQAAAGVDRLTRTVATGAGAIQANTGNIAAQFQDIGVTAAMGMNPLIIGLQQGTQLSAVFAQSGGSMGKVLAAAFMQIASAQALVTIGLVSAIAALIQLVDWSGAAQSALNGLADILPQVATAAAYLGAVLAIAFAPQILSAILTTISYIGTGLVAAVVAATQAMIAFSLANPFAAFVIAVGLAVAAIWAFNDDITRVLGVNVIQVAGKAANLILNSFRACFYDIQFVWRNFPAIIGAAAIGATNMVIRSINFLLEKGTAGINSLIGLANKGLDKLGIGPIASVATPQLTQMANASADRLTGAFAARRSDITRIMQSDAVGAIGDAISEATKWAQGKLRGMASSIGADAAKKSGGGAGADAARAAGAAKVAIPLDIPIVANPAMDLTLPKLDDIAPIETAVTRLIASLEQAREATKGFLQDFIGGVREGEKIFRSFGDAVVNSLNRIIDRILDKSFDRILDVMFSSLAQGFGSGGGIVGGIGKALGFENGGAFGVAQKFANGGVFTNTIVSQPTLFRFANGAKFGEMGESGPEAVMPLSRGPDGVLGVRARGGGGASMGDITINNEYKIDGGFTPDSAVAMIRQGGDETFDRVRRELLSMFHGLDADGSLI